MERHKAIFDTRDLQDLRPLYTPEDRPVFHPYTEVEPPTDPHVAVIGFDFNRQRWNVVSAATPEEVEELQETTDSLGRSVVQLTLQNLQQAQQLRELTQGGQKDA
ncbi:hypothetical protein ABRY77_14815 [Enterococcus casseliflavus]|uniref:hypothetical protein n=1 Tax=Enterococcus TaxID=1350 RepID=UPI000B6CDE0E|nr:hypothetical protein [Enterococcus sp. 4E1_DIV0656]MDO7880536.1 hypothetical protein [Enterococcus mundtii]OTO14150.1 hypothetical protein A5882_002575 [Enterococcus sp. 4E1_DIV0656]